jgi:SAM-dependent methyltransferase
MSDTVKRFSDRVENYVKYRPGYPAQVLDVFRAEMDLDENSVVADIGSGTGISARLFLENGNPVYGVEPNAEMRRAAEDLLRDFPKFVSVDGTAENTTLETASVDFVTAAQAFHWFDPERTRAEFRRILRPGGFVALMWNERLLDANDFLREYENFIIRYGRDYQQVRHDNIDVEKLNNFFRSDFSQRSFPNVQRLDFEGLRGRMLSSSYMPTESDERFERMILELKSLFDKYAENGKIEILYDTNIFYTQF